jgi:hypothetical protein
MKNVAGAWMKMGIGVIPVLGTCALLTVLMTVARAQSRDTLTGIIDIHVHSGPDAGGRERILNHLQVARLAKFAGMRGILLKNHYTQTADIAELVMQEVPGIEVFGGVALNRSVGGINPDAVRTMLEFEGKRGRIVFLPTWDAEYDESRKQANRSAVPVMKDGKLVPGLEEIFKLVAENDLVLSTGHSAPEESLFIIPIAKKAGVRKIVVQHPWLQKFTPDQLKRAKDTGALLECIFSEIKECGEAIKTLGAEHFVISSDLGQVGRPMHTDGWRTWILSLQRAGISQAQIDLVAKKTPARLMGLEPW